MDDLVRDGIDVSGIPRIWILAPGGAMRFESIGFSPDWIGENWIDKQKAQPFR